MSSHDIPASERVAKGTNVTATFDSNPPPLEKTDVPTVRGMMCEQALAAITSARLEPMGCKDSTYQATSTLPAEGSEVNVGTRVLVNSEPYHAALIENP